MIIQLRETIRQLGMTEGLFYYIGRAVDVISSGRWRVLRYYICAQPICMPIPTSSSGKSAINVKRISVDDPVCAFFPRSKELIKQRFDNGYVCLVANVKGRFAGYLWYACHAYEEDEVRCRFEFTKPEESVWDFDVYVVPEFRMGRTFIRLWETANAMLCNDGKRVSYSRIAPSNLKSITAHNRLGTKRIATLTFICFGQHQFMFQSKAEKFIHYSKSHSTRPIVFLTTCMFWISAVHLLHSAELFSLIV